MNEQKKTYIKPAIEGVYLLPDEVVLGGCKNVGQSGPPDAIGCIVAEAPCVALLT